MHSDSQEIVNGLSELVTRDAMSILNFDSVPSVIHTDHRHTLAVCRQSQRIRRLQEPTDLVLFDFHDDFANIGNEWREKLEADEGKCLPSVQVPDWLPSRYPCSST
jgi:hypothetical protein